MPTQTFPIAGDADDGTGYRTAAPWSAIASGAFTGEESPNPIAIALGVVNVDEFVNVE